jgi:MarR family transcriptional regulator, transcriptional regulator for hemolysin
MDSELSLSPGYLINRSSRLALRWTEEHFRPLGLAVAQMPVLHALRDGSAQTQQYLANVAQIEQPTMAQLLDRMERDGLISRSVNPDDKRSSLVSLTPAAIRRLPRARAVLARGSKEMLKGLSEREVATLCDLMQRVLDNLTGVTNAASARVKQTCMT